MRAKIFFLVRVAAGCRMPVVFGVIAPLRHIESMYVIESADCCGLGFAASGASVGLHAFLGFCRLFGDDAFVPYVRAKIFFLVRVAAGCRMPVVFVVVLPLVHIKRMSEFRNGFRFLIPAHRTSESFHAFLGFCRIFGDNACIESMVGFVRNVRVFFGHTFVPVILLVIFPFA